MRNFEKDKETKKSQIKDLEEKLKKEKKEKKELGRENKKIKEEKERLEEENKNLKLVKEGEENLSEEENDELYLKKIKQFEGETFSFNSGKCFTVDNVDECLNFFNIKIDDKELQDYKKLYFVIKEVENMSFSIMLWNRESGKMLGESTLSLQTLSIEELGDFVKMLEELKKIKLFEKMKQFEEGAFSFDNEELFSSVDQVDDFLSIFGINVKGEKLQNYKKLFFVIEKVEDTRCIITLRDKESGEILGKGDTSLLENNYDVPYEKLENLVDLFEETKMNLGQKGYFESVFFKKYPPSGEVLESFDKMMSEAKFDDKIIKIEESELKKIVVPVWRESLIKVLEGEKVYKEGNSVFIKFFKPRNIGTLKLKNSGDFSFMLMTPNGKISFPYFSLYTTNNVKKVEELIEYIKKNAMTEEEFRKNYSNAADYSTNVNTNNS